MAQNLCNYSKEEICNALKILKDICDYNNCSTCPFGYDGNNCKIQDNAPCDFDIEGQEEIWKALK